MKTMLKTAIVVVLAMCACVCEAKTIKEHGLTMNVVTQVGRRVKEKKAALEKRVDLEWKAIPDCMKQHLDEAAWKDQRKYDIVYGWKKNYSDEAAERHAQKAVLLKKTTTCWYYVPSSKPQAAKPQASAPKPAAKPKAKPKAKKQVEDIDVMAELPPEVKEFFDGSDIVVK